jgi:hypothetical protein
MEDRTFRTLCRRIASHSFPNLMVCVYMFLTAKSISVANTLKTAKTISLTTFSLILLVIRHCAQTPTCSRTIRINCPHGWFISKTKHTRTKLTWNSPIMKSQLYSGDWSVVIITNNGDGTQAAYERDFVLSVGPQSTVTVCLRALMTRSNTDLFEQYTPTVTVTAPFTPISSENRYPSLLLEKTVC